jgi:hypothetical protein
VVLPKVTVRGLDYSTLSRIRSRVRRRGISVNRLIVETLQREYAAGDQAFNDLDALVGAWSKTEAAAFAAAVAPFAENDTGLGSY